MDADTLRSLLDSAKPLAVSAGQAILKVDANREAVIKQDGSPLTQADLASHRTIDEGLRALQPALPILSEEGDLDRLPPGMFKAYWCVDPLDGTKEFIKGLDEYTVNIALVEKGRPSLGVVYVPASSVLYFAAEGLGAWKTVAGGEPQRIAPRDCDRPTIAVVSRSHLSDETQLFLDRFGITDVVRHGSSLKLCAVAEGSADIYPRLGPTCLWDTAAGAAVCREASCRVTDLDRNDLSYDPREGLKRPGFLVYPNALHQMIADAFA